MQNYFKYLNISQLEENWGFYVTTVGYSKIEPTTAYPNNSEHPTDHSFTWNKGRILDGYYIIFISKGQGTFESAHTEPIKVTEGTCFFLFPGVWHRYKPNPNSGWEEYWVGFRGTYPEQLMQQGFFNPENPCLKTGLHDSIFNPFYKLIETVKAGHPGYHQVITGITLQILGAINAIAMYKEQDQDPTRQLISKAQFLLQESLDKPVVIEDLVKELPMGYSKFRKAFKEITGLSPNQYHLDLRLNKAKELLKSTSLSINEIAFQTGFESVFYFSKLFKKKNNASPKFYRVQD